LKESYPVHLKESDLNDVSGKKFDQFFPNEDSFEKGLYMFDIGQNDLAGAFYSKTLDQILASIPAILLEFETGIKVDNIILLYKFHFITSIKIVILNLTFSVICDLETV